MITVGADPIFAAIQLAKESALNGGGPFGAVIQFPGGQTFGAANQVTELNDPTAHAEVQAIRLAAADRGFDLSGGVLYTSCEPCPMCMAAALWARLDRVVWAASSSQAAQAGFDDSFFWQQLRGEITAIPTGRSSAISQEQAFAPFEAWERNDQKVRY